MILFFSATALSRLGWVDPSILKTLSLPVFTSFSLPLVSIAFALLGLFTTKRWQRIGLCLSFGLTLFFLFFAEGEINYSWHIWLFASFFFCFLDPEAPLYEKKNFLVIRLIQTTLLSQYFIAGLWKYRGLLSHSSFELFLFRSLDHLAYAVAEGNGPASALLEFAKKPGFLSLIQIGFFAVLVFQISSIVPLVYDRFWKTWGLLAIGFHLATGIFLGIWLTETLLAAAFFLVFVEQCLESKKN